MSANAFAPASCPTATPGIRSRRRSIYTYAVMRAVVAARRGRAGCRPAARGARRRRCCWRSGAALGDRGVGQAAALLFLLLVGPGVRAARRRERPRAVRDVHRRARSPARSCCSLAAATAGRAGHARAPGVLFGARVRVQVQRGGLRRSPASFALLRLEAADRRGRSAALAAGSSSRSLRSCCVASRAGHALPDLYDATITYNVRYSGETYQRAAACGHATC